ncbi:MAG: sulfurtransferase [Spirulinaceae cyanobacterium SM2_1_0]|nr:sulfurtransferase [Spirulinaceae cyanobacterium SM2_1_0]
MSDPESQFASAREARSPAWIVSAVEAKALLQQGATLLDARPHPQARPLPGARVVRWQEFSQTASGQRGELLTDDDVLTARLRELGVRGDRPVIVVGDPRRDWGEDGRIVWMLRSLGHPQAVLVDGGYAALTATDRPQNLPVATPGDFTIARQADWSISQTEVRARLTQPGVVLLDTREAREYRGATPYGEQRGGHLPGAEHLYFQDLLADNGKLLPRDQIAVQLAQRGITAATEIVVYCTGGVRSAWLAVVLADLGYTVRNYAGSTWQWSAAPADSHPLE